MADAESKIVVPVKEGGVKRLDIYSVEKLLASHTEELLAPRSEELLAPRTEELLVPRTEELLAPRTEELTTEELSNFKFIDQWKKRSNKNRSQRMHFTQNFEANDVPCKCVD